MNRIIIALAAVCVCSVSAQVYLNQPIALALQQQPAPAVREASLAHPAVVENALHEAQYPDQFRNNFYKNPHIAEALAKHSWFGDKEMPVFEREADKIPRDRIVKIFKNAGFVRRR
uniref:Putative secreted protein n=1 Tax=Anopheles triannulatus TaxID=58253 RepID=A0A2M4AYC2_9DIPT